MEKTIFVIDDSVTNLYAAEAALEDDYNVITVPSGVKAAALLEKIRPHLILLDVEMPKMDGFAVLEYLKADARYSSIPVVMLTAMPDGDTEAKARAMGAVGFVAKPFSAEALLRRIAEHCGN